MRKLLRSIWAIITAPFRFVIWLVRSLKTIINRLRHSLRTYFEENEEEDSSLADAMSKAVDHPQGLLEHIEALRKHLLRALLAVGITTAISFTFIRQIMDFLAVPLEGGLESLKAIEVTENIGTVMRVSLLTGFAIAFPYMLFEIWLFIAPALRRDSRIRGLFALPIAMLLFLGGMAFTYYVMLPVALPFLFNFMGLATEARPQSYFSFVTSILFWIGMFFEFPLLAYLLADFGILKAKTLASQWRLAMVIIAVLAAAITPTIDPVTMGITMAPMIILYFLSILLSGLAEGGRRKRLPAD